MKKVFLWSGTILTALLLVTLGAAPSGATIYDLTSIPSTATVNGAIFNTPSSVVSGTGLIDSFVQIGASPTESGYNTDGRPPEFDSKTSATFNHSLLLNDLQDNIWTDPGTGDTYYEFVLDVNEQNNANSRLITMTAMQLFLTNDQNLLGYPFTGTATKIYDLDQGGDNGILLNYGNFSGSGRLDMFALVPTALFGNDLTKYVVLYSAFGYADGTDDGFEEWAHKLEGTFSNGGEQEVPEPATLLLTGAGLVALAVGFRRKLH